MNIIPQRYHIGIVLNTFYFPLTAPDLQRALSENGFELAPIPEQYPTGIRRYFGGTVARRGTSYLSIIPERNLIGIDSNSDKDVLGTLSSVLDLVQKDFQISLERDISYAEAITDLIVVSDRGPIEKISNLRLNQVYNEFDKIFGCETAPRLLSITPKGICPDNRNWFEIQIQSRLTFPFSQYYLNIVFRNEKIDIVTEFVRVQSEKIMNIVKIVEEYE